MGHLRTGCCPSRSCASECCALGTHRNPKPRRACAAGASSCRVSQGGWEGRDTGPHVGRESQRSSTSRTCASRTPAIPLEGGRSQVGRQVALRSPPELFRPPAFIFSPKTSKELPCVR